MPSARRSPRSTPAKGRTRPAEKRVSKRPALGKGDRQKQVKSPKPAAVPADTTNKMKKSSSASDKQKKQSVDGGNDGDRRDKTRKATKRSSTGGIVQSATNAGTKQNHTANKVMKLSPKKAPGATPKKVIKASPRKAKVASPRKAATGKTAAKASPKKAKPKSKTGARVSTSKLKGRAGVTKAGKTPTKKDKKPVAKPKPKGKAKSSATKTKKPVKKTKDEKKKVPAKTKKGPAAKETQQKGKKVAKHPNSKLTPNPDIVVVTKDPMFEVKNESEIPKVSDYVNCKRAIRAVLTKDNALLKKLINSSKEVPSVFIQRSVDVAEDALDYAIKMGNAEALKLLSAKDCVRNTSRKEMPSVLMSQEGTGTYNFRSLGHAVRAINVGRGCREGNNAFTKDLGLYRGGHANFTGRLVQAINDGVSIETLNLILNQSKEAGYNIEYQCANNICLAVRAGHHKLAGHLVKRFNVGGGYGFNKLHEEVLLATKPEQLSQFRSVSVIKKPYENDKITPLHCAAINPNPKILAKLLSAMPDTSFPDKIGFTPIHYAAACEGSGPLELLLSRGVRADEPQPKTLVTPLMIAAKLGRAQNIEVLMKNIKSMAVSDTEEKQEKMGVDKKDKKGNFAIHYATEEGHLDCVQSLVKHGADVESMKSAVNNKITPLMIAAQKGYFQLAKVLIEELGAVIEKRDKIKRTPLMLACMNGHYPVATLLLRKGADPNAKDSSGNTPIHYAAAYGWWHCLKLLLKAGGSPNVCNDWKIPPLGIAYLKGHFGISDLLLKQPNVDVNFRDDSGATLLLTTCTHTLTADTIEQLKYLIQKGADVTAVDLNNRNALHVLASKDYNRRWQPESRGLALEIVKVLIDKGCDPGLKDKSGDTPISIALRSGISEMLKALLVKGHQVSLEADESGENPLHRLAKNCRDNSQEPIIQILAELEKKSTQRQTDGVITLEEAAKMKDKGGCTPFLRCIVDNYTNWTVQSQSTLKALIDVCKSDINARVDSEKSRAHALHYLAAVSTNQAFSMILEMKPDLNAVNTRGYTPLLNAIEAKQTNNVKVLLSKGADPNGSDKFSHMALLLAIQQNLTQVIPVLIAKGATVHGSLYKNKQPSIMHYIPAYITDLGDKLKTAKDVVSAGASLDAVDDEKRTILHNAVNIIQSNVTTEFLEFLLDYKLDVFAVDNFGRLPIHYAFYKYNPFGYGSPIQGGQYDNKSGLDPIETVALLSAVMDGKKLNVQDKYGRTPLHYAAYRGALISGMHIAEKIDDIDVQDKDGHTPLSMAILNSKESMAIWLIQKGANINRTVTFVGLDPSVPDEGDASQDKEQPAKYWTWKALEVPSDPDPVAKTSLFQAVVNEDWQGAVYVMMDRIANFGISYPDAIEAVLAQHKYQLANELIRKLRNPRKLQSTNDKAQNLLHLLAIHAEGGTDLQAKIATSLLDNGVKLFATDHKGCTPLHYAAANMNAAVCRAFAVKDPVGFKSCITCADHRGRVPVTSLFWGLSYNNNASQIIGLIRQHNGGLDVCAPFPDMNILTRKQITRAESLEEWYHNLPNEKTTDVTPLIFMIEMNDFDGCKSLLQSGASPNATDRNGVTPLMHAIMQNEIVLVNVLVNHSYTPDRAGKKRISDRPKISPWATNIWGQKKSGSYHSNETVRIDDGYEEDQSQDQTKVEKCKKTSNINLNAQDSSGRTAIHYLMKTCDNGTYENEEILEMLARLGAKLSLQDHRGKTPLDYAIESGSRTMAGAVQKLAKVAPQRRVYPKPVVHSWMDGIDFPLPKPDVNSDAQAMVELLEAERRKTKKVEEVKTEVDDNSGMTGEGVVLMDEDQNIAFDALMTKVEVQYGHYGMNNFYKMQLIHQLGKDMIVLFTRWGRIGDTGQFQKTPFGTQEEAITEFKKIFRAKSGNDWANVKSFQKQPKKYKLVQSDPWRAKRNDALKDFQFDLDSPIPSKLPKDLQNVLKELTMPQTLKRAFRDTGVDISIMNFSNLSKDVLNQADGILDIISKKLEEDRQTRSQGVLDVDRQIAAMEEMAALSNEYFYLIPHTNFAHDVMQPITNNSEVQKHKKKIYNLLELEMTNRILLGATYRKQEMNPLDYIYRALDCHLKIMDEDDAETQLLLQYIHYSSDGKPPKVQAIFRLSRDGEEERLKACKLGNHKLLWHGSSTINLLSILKQGLLISPREAELTGNRFGEGIYTSDTFAKSINYCRRAYHQHQEESQFMLLCEVALGKMMTPSYGGEERKAEFKSTFAQGRTRTNTKRELLLPSGVSVPVGRLRSPSGYRYGYLSDYSEYVAHSEDQVCLRYLVQVV